MKEMKTSVIRLSAAGFKNIKSKTYENSFQFIVGDMSYLCAPFLADFLSPRISTFRELDPTLSSFVVSTPDISHEFSLLLSLVSDPEIAVPVSSLPFLSELAIELGNVELHQLLTSFPTTLTRENAVSRFRLKMSAGAGNGEAEQYLAKHFSEVWPEMRRLLTPDQIGVILNHHLLQIPTEDWLIEELISFVKEDASRMFLFENVYFELVSVDLMRTFTEFVSSCDEDSIPNLGSIWRRLCRRLHCQLSSSLDVGFAKSWFSKRQDLTISPPLNRDGGQFDGVISHLRRRFGDESVVAIASSGSGRWEPENSLRYDQYEQFCSSDNPGQWFKLGFYGATVYATHYTIQSRLECDRGQHHPKSWIVEVSDDGVDWVCVDRRQNDDHLNGRGVVHTFEIGDPRFGRFVRLTQTGPTHRGDHYLTFANLEVLVLVYFSASIDWTLLSMKVVIHTAANMVEGQCG
jgi:hypothetical protein